MSTKKIEGRANRNPLYPGQTYSFSDLGGGRGEPAKLVLTEEPVYTQSEVVAMLREMEEDYHTETSRQQFYAIAAAHGITL